MINENLILSSGTLRVEEILKKTKAAFFGNIEVGHIIIISRPLNARYYTNYVTVENISNGETTSRTYNDLYKWLDYFKLQRVQ